MVARTYVCVVCKNSNVQQYVCFELCREHVWPLRWKFVGDLAGSLIAIGENIVGGSGSCIIFRSRRIGCSCPISVAKSLGALI